MTRERSEADPSGGTERGLTEKQINIMSQGTIAPTIGGTADTEARGTEYEVNINPTRYWTMTANFTDSQSILRNVSSAAGDWLEYTLEIPAAGTYNLRLRVAGPSAGSVQVLANGVDVTGAWTLPKKPA